MNKKILIGMSGGVDSSAAASLLLSKGYEVIGVYLIMHDFGVQGENDAREVSNKLAIPFYTLDLREEFKNTIEEYFVNSYLNGETPNPCIVCNPTLKFKSLKSFASELECDYIATGHYANLVQNENGRYTIKMSKDKDQSYMLYRLPQDILKMIKFPLYNMEKTNVREFAREKELSVYNKKDSQEICFIPDNDYRNFIINTKGNKQTKGDIIGPTGDVVGTHNGIIGFTMGQRRGLGVALGKPVFVSKIDSKENKVYLAFADGQFKKEVYFNDVNFMGISEKEFKNEIKAFGKVRYGKDAFKCIVTLEDKDNGIYKAVFEKPIKSIAKGQSLVVYDSDNKVIMGGFICK